ncbi:MAG: manganese ABC transporter ATP-binding protein [Crocinitomicaceae bacterium]|nr:manganese ABC transporter ATP-binding protein [Crocinitomicaceae bacterium]|tara:strand:- start:51647 stop:52420 length:774 start_codon:yes stop_codon:yes gene_type:complete
MIKKVNDPIIEVHNLTVSYDNNPVVWNANFSVPQGKMVGIVGPNGAGKSTLLKSIMGLIPRSTGNIKIFNKNINSVISKVAYVPQKESVDWDFPATVFDVVEMGRYGKKNLFKRLNNNDRKIVSESLEKVKMENYHDYHISELSGGQQQRVFIARALAQESDIYFMDEPFSGIDIATEKTIFQVLLQLKKEGKTIFVVHHNLQSVMNYFDWTILINKRIIASGPTSDVFTQEFLRRTYDGNLTLAEKTEKDLKRSNL